MNPASVALFPALPKNLAFTFHVVLWTAVILIHSYLAGVS
jgi:hypothetical protein